MRKREPQIFNEARLQRLMDDARVDVAIIRGNENSKWVSEFFNNGGTDELRSEQDVSERILLQFDLAALAQTSTLVSATLTLEILQTHPSGTWQLHPVLEPWTEGALDGAPGVANFTQRTAALNWSTAGCGEPASAAPTVTTVSSIPRGFMLSSPFRFGSQPSGLQRCAFDLHQIRGNMRARGLPRRADRPKGLTL